ncbi:hypothetical protein [Acuticoccus sp.]|uniref:hypothetical protein n=1 Tax=Acuticoccus sp. TaxID=1904378 RepID=UPI003B51B242
MANDTTDDGSSDDPKSDRKARRAARKSAASGATARDPAARAATRERRAAKRAERAEGKGEGEGAATGKGQRRGRRAATAGSAEAGTDAEAGAKRGAGARAAKRERRSAAAGEGTSAEAATDERRARRSAVRAERRAAGGGSEGARRDRRAVRAARGSAATGNAAMGEGKRGYLEVGKASQAGIEVSDGLYARFATLAIEVATDHFLRHLDGKGTLGATTKATILDGLAAGRELGLFGRGGIREHDFVNLSVLAALVKPELYVESGVFRGSSLFAFHRSKDVRRIVAIDPDLSALKFRDEDGERTRYVTDQDFSQIDFGAVPSRALVYFDDHVSTTKRIMEAADKGFGTLVFDDSFGLTGMARQQMPSTPTLPFILHHDRLEVGDVVAWSTERRRFEFKVTDELMDELSTARERIDRVVPFPNLFDYMANPYDLPIVGGEKALVLLK